MSYVIPPQIQQILNRAPTPHLPLPTVVKDQTWFGEDTPEYKQYLKDKQEIQQKNRQIDRDNQALKKQQQDLKRFVQQQQQKQKQRIRNQQKQAAMEAVKKNNLQQDNARQKKAKEKKQQQNRKQKQLEKKQRAAKEQEQRKKQEQQQKQLSQKYKDNYLGSLAHKASSALSGITDAYEGSDLKQIVDGTYDTVKNYAGTAVDQVKAIVKGNANQAQGQRQSNQAKNDLYSGNFIDAATNFVSGKYNQWVGEAQSSTGWQNLDKWGQIIAPTGLALAGLAYKLKKSPVGDLASIYQNGGSQNFGSLAKKYAKDKIVDLDRDFQSNYEKYKNKRQNFVLKKGARAIQNKVKQIGYEVGQRAGNQLTKFGSHFKQDMANKLNAKWKDSKMGKYIFQKQNPYGEGIMIPQQFDLQQVQKINKKIKQ